MMLKVTNCELIKPSSSFSIIEAQIENMCTVQQRHNYSNKLGKPNHQAKSPQFRILSFRSGIILTRRNNHGQTPCAHHNAHVYRGVDC